MASARPCQTVGAGYMTGTSGAFCPMSANFWRCIRKDAICWPLNLIFFQCGSGSSCHNIKYGRGRKSADLSQSQKGAAAGLLANDFCPDRTTGPPPGTMLSKSGTGSRRSGDSPGRDWQAFHFGEATDYGSPGRSAPWGAGPPGMPAKSIRGQGVGHLFL